MLFNKPNRTKAEINGSSMADIAFLLLIFFLVTTTINVDTGIGLVLPPPITEPPKEVKARNIMNILVNSEGVIMMDENQTKIQDIQFELKKFITNRGRDENLSESPQKAIISIKTQRKTPYSVYIDVLDEIMGCYKDLRDEAAYSNFGVAYGQLKSGTEQQSRIKKMYPVNISLAEPAKD